jgi:flagellar hook-associated protein 3 FlgL
MRITNKMMINNSIYWISKQSERLSDAELVVASGKQVNKPSDNPDAAAQILEYRSAISKYDQYQTNIDNGNTWVEMDETVLDSVDTLLDNAVDIASGYSSAESDTKQTCIESLKSIYNQIIDLANTKCGSDYLYGGTRPDSPPFSDEVSVSSGTPDDISLYLASAASAVSITVYDSDGNTVRNISSSGSEGTNTISWNGLDDDGNTLADGDYTFTVTALDSSGDPVSSSCCQSDSGSKKIIIGDGSSATINTSGGAVFSDAFSALTQLISSLESGTTDTTEATKSLSDAIETIASERVGLSNIYSQMDISTDRVDALTELIQEKLSAVETGSTDEAAVILNAQETNYETTMAAASKILDMPTLSDYI